MAFFMVSGFGILDHVFKVFDLIYESGLMVRGVGYRGVGGGIGGWGGG